MAGVFKRRTGKERGAARKWTCWWIDDRGKVRQKAGTTDRVASLDIARKKESEARLIREGLLDPKDLTAQDASRKPLSAHIDDYRIQLVSKGDGPKHCRHVAGTLKRLMAGAGVNGIAEITSDKIRLALGRIVAGGRSARTANHAQDAARAFTRWLKGANRLKEDPLVLMSSRYKEEIDVRYRRRDLSMAELDRLVRAADGGPDYVARRPEKSKHLDIMITGPDRAIAYLIAMGTGFRVSEIRSLTPESFAFGEAPVVTVKAAYTKNDKDAEQPITRDLAGRLAAWLRGKPPAMPVLTLPEKTAKMIRFDLALAGIEAVLATTIREIEGRTVKTVDGVVDFHALRASYITHLIESGVNPKTVQDLARHSTVTLTIHRYTKTDDRRKREAIEGMGSSSKADPEAPDADLHD